MPPEKEGTPQNLEDQGPVATDRINQFLQANWNFALQTDQFEVAEAARGQVSSLKSWRQSASRSPFPQFYQLVEAATLLNRASASQEERAALVDQLTSNARTFSPRVRDLYLGLLSKLDGSSFNPEFPEITEPHLAMLQQSGDLSLLQNPNVPWNVKLNRVETRIESELGGRKSLDKRDKQQEAAQQPTEPSTTNQPPDARDESKPGMDEMQRLKEGEQAPAIWSISPAYGGYYKEQSFDTWDISTNTWRQSEYRYEDYLDDVRANKSLITSALIPRGKTVRLPVPYTHGVMFLGGATKENVPILQDQNGDYVIQSKVRFMDTPVTVHLTNEVTPDDRLHYPKPNETISMPSTLTEETEAKLKEVQGSRKNDVDRARALASYTMRRLKYSNNSSLNGVYDSDPDGYIGAIDKYKEADCDVANTYFAALCSRLDIMARHVVGHMVKGKDSEGNSKVTSGTGHAWTEIYDKSKKQWIRIDATPPGDPQLEQDEQGEGMPGDYGGQEAIGPSDEELQQLEEKLSQVSERLSYTQEERQLAEATGVQLKEARQIIKEIQEAENTRLPNGERIVDVLAQAWSLLTQSRIRTQQEYTGPLRKREGGEEIDDIVAHKIGIRAGELDPASRQKEDERRFTEPLLSALQAHIIGDKSGSMSQTVDGETKWGLQRRAMYLILSSLDRAEKNVVRVKARMHDPYDLYSQVISFRDSHQIDVDKPLSNQFSLEDKVKLWKSLGNQGSGNGDVPALNHLYHQIQSEQESIVGEGKQDKTLRVVIACSDGMPDNPTGVQQMAQKLGELNTVVVGVGLTETATQVPIIFNTPYSRGDLARDLNDLPAIVAKHIVMEAIKLFPDRARVQYQRQIDTILGKFSRVGIQ